jgi:hypothetical protein
MDDTMKNRKQLLADFYLDLLAIDDEVFRSKHYKLYIAARNALSDELDAPVEVIGRIFERMAAEDSK